MNRPPVSRIGDVQSLTPQRLYVGASATGEQWSRVLIDSVVAGLPVRVLVDEETCPTLELMVNVAELAAAGGLVASWVLNLPLSVDLTVRPVAPSQSTGSHGKRVSEPAGEDGAPTPASPAGVGSISNPIEEVAP